jgi:amino acid adenylation domain-containing protein/FkbM family methyltransferase
VSAALVPSTIERQVDRTPDARAVTFADTSVTYRELDERANRLAHHLIAHGARHDQPIGVALERSPDLIVTLLAILKTGAPYLPIDPSYPAPRIEAMREDGGWAVVVDRAGLDAHRAAIEARARTRPGVEVDGDHAAYVIFTSGSTGRPKGAVLTHAGLANRLTWMQAAFALGADDAVLHKTPFTFDVSVWELFWPLMTGARLVIARPEGHRDPLYLAETIARERVTTVHFVPSMLGPFLEVARTSPCPDLRRVVCSGEALSPALVREAGEVLPAELHNLYGPTEASIDVSWWRCDPRVDTATVPIGAPIANTRMYVLDPEGQAAAVGAPGELFLAGVQLARAYSRRPDLTAERFVPDPFHAGERMYRTGDLARVRPDGAIEYLGRVDHQVKLRGYRIELGEIEATVAALPDVRDVVVLAREDRPGDQRLAAYVIARDPSRPPAADTLRDHVRAHLPDYMVPSDVIVLDAFPTTANGKLDRAALPAPGSHDEVARVVRAHPDVDEVVVMTRDRRLVGYVVPRPEASPTVDGAPRYVLPNQMAVAQLHRYETDFMYEELFVRQAHQRHGIRLRDDMTVVDVGANIGLFGLFCAQACATPRIFAFEPNPAVRARLEANLAAYAPGARTFACAVGAAPGHARFTVFSGYSLLSGLHPDAATETELVKSYVLNQGRAGAQGADDFARDAEAVLRERFVEQQIDVDIRTLADVIASEHIDHIDLLKIDVEKAEVDVLAGLGIDDWAKI